MKRYVCIFLFLLAVLGMKAQSNDFPASQLLKAVKCRMMKVKAMVLAVNGKMCDDLPQVGFTLLYGAQGSGYSSEDYIVLLGDDLNEWKRNGFMGFMDMPDKIYRDDVPLKGGKKNVMTVFFAKNFRLAMYTMETRHPKVKSEAHISVCQIHNGKETDFVVTSCDFYDISSGKERLVLADYYPSKEDYSAGNLFRVFMDKMYEYYR